MKIGCGVLYLLSSPLRFQNQELSETSVELMFWSNRGNPDDIPVFLKRAAISGLINGFHEGTTTF